MVLKMERIKVCWER